MGGLKKRQLFWQQLTTHAIMVNLVFLYANATHSSTTLLRAIIVRLPLSFACNSIIDLHNSCIQPFLDTIIIPFHYFTFHHLQLPFLCIYHHHQLNPLISIPCQTTINVIHRHSSTHHYLHFTTLWLAVIAINNAQNHHHSFTFNCL